MGLCRITFYIIAAGVVFLLLPLILTVALIVGLVYLIIQLVEYLTVKD